MKNLAILLTLNLGFNGLLLAAHPAATSAPVAPAVPVSSQLLDKEGDIVGEFSNLAVTGGQQLIQHATVIENTIKALEAQGQKASDIGTVSTEESFESQINTAVGSGQSSLNMIAQDYKNKIDNAKLKGAHQLTVLAGTDANNLILASTLSNSLGSQADTFKAQIESNRSDSVNNITVLQTSSIAAIKAASKSHEPAKTLPDPAKTAPDSGSFGGSSSLSKEAIDHLVEGIMGTVGTLATGFGLYFAKSTICKFTKIKFLNCPPEMDEKTKEWAEKIGLSENADINELLQKIGLNKVADFLNKSAEGFASFKQELAEKLKLTPQKIEEFITKAGTKLSVSEENITKFLKKYNQIRTQLEEALPQAKIEEIIEKVGAKLSEVTGTEIDVNSIVDSVKAELSVGNRAPSGPKSVSSDEREDLVRERGQQSRTVSRAEEVNRTLRIEAHDSQVAIDTARAQDKSLAENTTEDDEDENPTAPSEDPMADEVPMAEL